MKKDFDSAIFTSDFFTKSKKTASGIESSRQDIFNAGMQILRARKRTKGSSRLNSPSTATLAQYHDRGSLYLLSFIHVMLLQQGRIKQKNGIPNRN
jgi:hypothetical protein